jgi:hypothetical protein
MATKGQIIAIQTAKRALKLSDPAYRMILRNVGGVESSTLLTNEAFDQVMAVFEESGFQSHPAGPTYWRDKAARGGDRAAWKLRQLAGQTGIDAEGFSARMSKKRTRTPESLTPRERYNAIEGLKKIAQRDGADAVPLLTPEVLDDIPF